MRNIPGYPMNADVVEPVVRVLHGGRDREVDSVSLSRELPSSFHEQVRGIGGITQATGSVDWAPLADVVESYPTGFNRVGDWPPKTRDAADVYTGVRTAAGDLLAKQLTGFVSKSSGDPSEGVGSGLVDRIARLSRKVTVPPLLNTMPPLADGGPWRGVGLYPTYFTDLAARAGGFFSTPSRSSGCVFSAPLMGSAWPEQGILVTGLRFTDRNNANAIWQEVPWGMAVSDAFLQYTPTSGRALTQPMEITAMRSGGSGDGYVSAMWGDSFIKLNFSGTNVRALVTTGGVSQPTVAQMTVPEDGVFTLRAVPSGGALDVTLRAHTGQEASASIARPGDMASSMNRVEVASNSSSMKVGGAQVSFPAAAWDPVSQKRSAFITPAAHNASLRASPPIMGRSAKGILEEQSAAELAALWIDGDGNLRWVNRNRLIGGAPVATLTSKDSLKSLPWEEDFAGVASVVEVAGRKPTVQQSKQPSLSMWDSGTSSTDPGDTFEWLIHPDADMDWIMPDTDIKSLHREYMLNGFPRFNKGIGSWIALWADRKDGLTATFDSAAYASCSFVDHRTYRVAATVVGFTNDNHLFDFTLKIPGPDANDPTSNAGPTRYQPGLSTPVIRGKGLTMWEDVTYTEDAGVWDAPVLTHDVGWWVQDPAACQAIANLLALNTTTPRPFLGGVSIVPDARLQLGDVVTVRDDDITGVEFRCLIVGIDDRFTSSPITWEQSCNFRVLSTTTM